MANSMSIYRQNGVDYVVDDPTIAPVFIATKNYYIGQYVKHGGNLYCFKATHPAGEWDASHVTQVILCDEATEIRKNIDGLTSVQNLSFSLLPNKYVHYENGRVIDFEDSRAFATTGIRVTPGATVYIENYRDEHYNADAMGLAFYSNTDTFVSGVRYTPPNAPLKLTVPEDAHFLRVTYLKESSNGPLLVYQTPIMPHSVALECHEIPINSTPSAPYDDANTLPIGTVVTYIGRANFPSNIPAYSGVGVSCTIATYNYSKLRVGGAVQILTEKENTWIRFGVSETVFGAWKKLNAELGYPINTAERFVAPFTDMNTLPVGVTATYIGNDFFPANIPSGITGTSFTCFTTNYSSSKFGGRLQIVADTTNFWFRYAPNENEYRSWVPLNDSQETIHQESVFSLFENVGVLGDSYACGSLTLYSPSGAEHLAISWPRIVARKNGINVTHFARGGMTTRMWLTNERGLPLLQSESAKDLYLCVFGINDNALLGLSYLGVESDIGTDNDTFYGNYGKIIDAIQTKAPDAKIVLSTMAPAAPGAYVSQFNAAIVKIAEHFGIPCMIQGEDPFFISSQYVNNIRYNHPMAGGYVHMANAFDRMLCKVMDNNVEYFATYGLNK